MKATWKPSSLAVLLFFTFLFSAQVLPRVMTDSLTFDEPSDIANGYYYLTQGDVVTPHNHPPLGSALQALPLLAMGLQTFPFKGDVIDRGHFFVFDWNQDRIAAVTVASRLVSWLWGLGMGLLLWRLTRKRVWACAGALFFWALEPTFSAVSGLAKTDIAPTILFFVAVLLFRRSQKEPSHGHVLAAGVAAAMAVTAKLYCLVLLPVFAVLEILEQAPWKGRRKKRGKAPWAVRWGWGLAGFAAWIFLLYLPAAFLQPDHRQPFDYFARKFSQDVAFVQTPHPVYLLGHPGLESHWYYFPLAFLLKEPLPFLAFLLLGAVLALGGRLRLEPWQWVPPFLFTLAILPAVNLGVRYLLPTLPFYFLIAGEAAAWFWENRKGGPWRGGLVVVLALWQAVSVASQFPRAISYFNELVPEEKKIHYLGDSNLDWGQDLKRLAAVAAERKWGRVKLAYMGAVDPAVYGLSWEPWREKDLTGPQPGWVYAVNAGFLQLSPTAYPPTRSIAESWVSREVPTGKVMDTWYYFEVPGVREDAARQGAPLVSVPFQQYRGYVSPGPGGWPPR